MRIGMILNAGFPPDIRVEKEIHALLASHDVFLLCTKRSGEADTEFFSGLRITRVFSGLQRRLASYQLMTSCYSERWKNEIHRFIGANQLEALHVHDLPLAGTALDAARSHSIPIVLDLHEDYPALLTEIKKTSWSRIPSVGVLGVRLASIPKWKQYEQRVVSAVDAVIAVVDESQARISDLGVEPSKIFLVPNYGPVVPMAKADQPPEGNRVTAVYVGGFDRARDLQTVIDAASLLANRGCDGLNFRLVGGSRRDIALLERYAFRKRLAIDKISFHKWIDRDLVERILDHSQIGLVPHVKSPHTDSTIPHKLFQYMTAQLPVVASNCVPLERIVSDSRCGVIYESGNSESLAACLEELYRNPDQRKRMGDAGLFATQMKYNWIASARVLLKAYQQLETDNTRRKSD